MNRTSKITLLFLLLLTVGYTEAACQIIEPANNIQITVRASVTPSGSSLFSYNYGVQSSQQSTQNVWEFRVIFRIPNDSVSQATTLSGWWNPMFLLTGEMPSWVSWTALDSGGIVPGAYLGGFGFKSGLRPGMTDYYAEGFHHAPWFPEGEAVDSIPGYDDLTPYGPGIVGKTIGPVPIPLPFVPTLFLDTLNSYVSQSRTLGWISTQSIADKYTGLYTRTKSDIVQFNLKLARSRIDTVLLQVIIDSSSAISSEAYALIRFNTEYLRDQLKPTNQVKAGVFNPSGGTISVKAKPSIAFGSSDTLKCIEVTVRWLTSYGITLGAVSSPTYGFSKDGSVTTVGNYSYQKFRTTTSNILNWSANTEYELFTVPVTGYSGIENFELTNALSGGEWFVDVNYLDKTDSAVYQGTATGFAYQNKSTYSSATWTNSDRHMVKAGGKLHEVYSSGGEILYRRSTGLGSTLTWEVTSRVDTGAYKGAGVSCLTAGQSALHLVWQCMYSSYGGKVMYARSTDNGTTWSQPIKLDSVTISANQGGSIYPVIAEWNTSVLAVVYCTSTGLKSQKSNNNGATWSSVSISQHGGGYDAYVWYPSITPVAGYLSLTYDYRYYGVYSRTFDGTNWSGEANVNSGPGTIYDRYSSVAIGSGGKPIAAWCAQKTGDGDYRILWRQGNLNNTWGWYIELPKDAGYSNYWPSIAWVKGVDAYVCNHRSDSQIKLTFSNYTNGFEGQSVLSTNGQWSNITIQTSTTDAPYVFWNDQTGAPYTIQYWTGFLQPMAPQPGNVEQHRRAGLQSQVDQSTLTFEVSPIKIITTTGQTVGVPFKMPDLSKDLSTTVDNVWDYLGSDKYTIPSNAKTLVVDVAIDAAVVQDSAGYKGANSFTSKSFRVDIVKGTQTTSLLTDPTGSSGSKTMDVSQYAGQQVVIRPVGVIPNALTSKVTASAGDVYVKKP